MHFSKAFKLFIFLFVAANAKAKPQYSFMGSEQESDPESQSELQNGNNQGSGKHQGHNDQSTLLRKGSQDPMDGMPTERSWGPIPDPDASDNTTYFTGNLSLSPKEALLVQLSALSMTNLSYDEVMEQRRTVIPRTVGTYIQNIYLEDLCESFGPWPSMISMGLIAEVPVANFEPMENPKERSFRKKRQAVKLTTSEEDPSKYTIISGGGEPRPNPPTIPEPKPFEPEPEPQPEPQPEPEPEPEPEPQPEPEPEPGTGGNGGPSTAGGKGITKEPNEDCTAFHYKRCEGHAAGIFDPTCGFWTTHHSGGCNPHPIHNAWRYDGTSMTGLEALQLCHARSHANEIPTNVIALKTNEASFARCIIFRFHGDDGIWDQEFLDDEKCEMANSFRHRGISPLTQKDVVNRGPKRLKCTVKHENYRCVFE